MTEPTLGVILAGGLARRMGGGDKALRTVGGQAVLTRLIARLLPQVARLILNANGDPARFEGFGLPVAGDAVPDRPGPLAGVLAGLDWAARVMPGVRWVVTVPGDAPFLPEDLVARLHDGRGRAALACAASGGRTHPVAALWPVALRHDLRRALVEEGVRKVGAYAGRHGPAVVEWPVGRVDPFFNVNTPDDLAQADRLAAGQADFGVRPSPVEGKLRQHPARASGTEDAVADATRRDITANGIRLQVMEQGTGPLVLLCHGWPEIAHSWRHQLPALAAAGYRAVAPDMRGFGGSDAPEAMEAYSLLHLVGDVVGLVAALGEREAVVVGHDWGANVAWNCALLRPDLFRAVAAMSVPYRPRGPAPPLAALRAAGRHDFYWLYFQPPGVAEAEFERDPAASLRRILGGIGPDRPLDPNQVLMLPKEGGFLDLMPEPVPLPAWLPEGDLAVMADAYRRTGFRGGLNYYRNIDRNWELLAPWQGALIRQPALFIAGQGDPVIASAIGQKGLEALPQTVPGLRRAVMIEGAGHWIQQERPDEVNAALIAFLRALG